MPQSESEFKRAYARTALAAGLTREQIVRIYGFEAGGNGDYDVQAGLEYNKRARAITTALGYNQLLSTNTVEIMAENGSHFIRVLTARAAISPRPPRSRRWKARSPSSARWSASQPAFLTIGTSMKYWRIRRRGSLFTR